MPDLPSSLRDWTVRERQTARGNRLNTFIQTGSLNRLRAISRQASALQLDLFVLVEPAEKSQVEQTAMIADFDRGFFRLQ